METIQSIPARAPGHVVKYVPRATDITAELPANEGDLNVGSPFAPSALLRRWIRGWRLLRQFAYDFRRVSFHTSAVIRGDRQEKLEALITMAYHSLEKGLSLAAPRPCFGLQHVETLIRRLQLHLDRYGSTHTCRVALNVLSAYLRFNREQGYEMPNLARRIEAMMKVAGEPDPARHRGGVRSVTRAAFEAAAKRDLRDFFQMRSSVRQYSPEPVAFERIQSAVELALKTPCVCNRQSWKVWAYTRPGNIRKALEIQSGAAGFGENVGVVLVVASDLSYFQSPGERNQCWIDGGMFAMSLVYALHAAGLATCCLNWSKTRDTDLRFKREFGIPESQSIIMLVSVGHPPETFEVANSWRKPVEEILKDDRGGVKPVEPRSIAP